MPALTPKLSLVAAGDIRTSRFITKNTTNREVAESNSGDVKIIGVTNEGAKEAPQSGSSALHAVAADAVTYYGWGEDCLLVVGSGGLTAGDWVKPDNDGAGVTAASAAVAGALCIESASEGQKARVLLVQPFTVP